MDDVYEFSATTMRGCINEGMQVILVEAASCLEYQNATEELLVEYAGSEKYGVLQETIMASAKNMTVKFLQQCERVSRAVVQRLKEFSYKLASRTEDYLRVIQPRVDAAKSHPGWESLTADDIYPWNPVFLESGISNGIRKLHLTWSAAVVSGAFMETILRTSGARDDELAEVIEQLDYDAENIEDTAIDAAANAFGVAANSSDDLWAVLTLKAHGNAREPGYTYGRDIDRIMATLANSSKLADNVRKTYEEHARELHDFANELKGDLDEAEGRIADGADADTLEQAIKSLERFIVRVTEFYESLMGKANSMNISMIQQMTADYMRCVSMFVAYKGATAVSQRGAVPNEG